MNLAWFVRVLGFAFTMTVTPRLNNMIAITSGVSHGMTRSLPLLIGGGVGVAAIISLS
ncbi:hypothetical protein D3C76_1300540 [compost metagenome]